MKILVAVDKSEESQMALRYTCHLLEHFDARVDALYVKPDVVETVAEGSYAPFTSRGEVERAIEGEAQRVVEEIIESCEICVGGKIPCNPRVAVGEPADEILHHALQPVLLMRNFRPITKVLVAYRGSRCDQGALEFIAPLFAKKKPEITVMHVQETELGETDDFAQSCLLTGEDTLKSYGLTAVKKMAQGDFVDEILKAVAVERYDLLVLGAYGHQRPKYLKVLSDEALNLVRLTTRPVLVYRDKSES